MARREIYLGVLLLATLAAVAGVQTQGRKIPLRIENPLLQVPPAIIAETDTTNWQFYDDGFPLYYFPLPDQYNDHYFNVRFTAPDSCRLLQAAFLFRRMPGDSTSISRDIHIVVFKGTPGGTLPLTHPSSPDTVGPKYAALDSVIVPGNQVLVSPETTFVDLTGLDTLHFRSGDRFHVGWEPDTASLTTGIRALWSDNGDPPTTYSCEWWGDSTRWGTMLDDWGRGVNFMIRVQIEGPLLGIRRWLDPDRPAAFELYPPSPNPFNGFTTISYELRAANFVSLKVYDTAGRRVATLVEGWREPGNHQVIFDPIGANGSRLPSSLYLYRLSAGTNTATGKMVLLK